MFSIKLILGGIGLLIFAICCTSLANQWNLPIFAYIFVASTFIGIILVLGGLFNSDNNEK
ncbi:MAG: hypothetical protein K0R09_552 [Clostridiales bacterium]|nr:hypothetical protein [Clostridiales bacterium]